MRGTLMHLKRVRMVDKDTVTIVERVVKLANMSAPCQNPGVQVM
jgi:hypothetical protein